MDNPLRSDLDHVLDHTRGLWDELRGERIFITGGTGFFGCWLLESFLWANSRLALGSQAVVLTRNPEAFRKKAPCLATDPAVTLITGDVRTFEFRSERFSHVIHAATETRPPSRQLEHTELFVANLDGTRHLLDFAVRCRSQRVLFTSSGAVYGKQPADLIHIPEDYPGAPDPTDPATAYGQSKRASEFLLASGAASGLQVKIARCFAFVGPGLPLDSNFAIGNFIRDALRGRCIHINGDGTPFRSYLYASDLAIWLWTILFRGAHARPYNVGSDHELTIEELAAQVAQVVAPGMPIEIAVQPTPGQAAQRYVPSVARARHELDLEIYIRLPDAIKRTADFYSK